MSDAAKEKDSDEDKKKEVAINGLSKLRKIDDSHGERQIYD